MLRLLDVLDEGGSGNGPSAFEGRLEVTGKVNDIDEFCMAAEGSTNVVVEKELESGARMDLEQGTFNVAKEEAGNGRSPWPCPRLCF